METGAFDCCALCAATGPDSTIIKEKKRNTHRSSEVHSFLLFFRQELPIPQLPTSAGFISAPLVPLPPKPFTDMPVVQVEPMPGSDQV